jgi:phosphatidylglycerol:prolipoprotein diacylglycerol transferase
MIPALDVGGWSVGTHDLFSIVGILVGLGLYYHALRRREMLDRPILFISLAVLVGGGLGGRLLLSFEHLPAYADLGRLPLTWVIEHSGKSLIGAIVGGWIAAVLAKRAFGYRRSTGDCYALAIAVAVAIGRVGCFLSELPLGTPTDLPWGVRVPAESAASFTWCPGCDGPMHPSMLYEIAFNVLAVAAILRWRHRLVVQGDLLKSYLLAAFTFRFIVEFVRGNPPQVFGLSGPQLVLVPLIALLVLHFAREIRSSVLRVPLAPTPPGHSVREGGVIDVRSTVA